MGNILIVWRFLDDDILSNDLVATFNQSVSPSGQTTSKTPRATLQDGL